MAGSDTDGPGRATRRQFLGALAAGLLPALPRWSAAAAAASPARKAPPPDLVGVRGGSPAQMFDVGIKALGGLGRFVRKGQTVLVKPNIGWSKTPNEGATTNPELVARIVSAAYAAGARKAFVFDHSVDNEEECYQRSGIAEAAKAAGAEVRTASDRRAYRKKTVPGGKTLRDVEVHELYLDCDVVINVPILKNHGGANMTCALKNLMGVVWDRGAWHRLGLQQAIAEFPLVRKPDLNVVDAFIVMRENGPRGLGTEDLLLKKTQILSPDAVLADAAAAKTLGLPVSAVPHIGLAAKLGVGSLDLERKTVKRVTLGG